MLVFNSTEHPGGLVTCEKLRVKAHHGGERRNQEGGKKAGEKGGQAKQLDGAGWGGGTRSSESKGGRSQSPPSREGREGPSRKPNQWVTGP